MQVQEQQRLVQQALLMHMLLAHMPPLGHAFNHSNNNNANTNTTHSRHNTPHR